MSASRSAMETAAALRAFVHAQRPSAWSQGYPAVVRERVRAYTAARRAAGANAGMIAVELGLSRHSILAWAGSRMERPGLRQVVVVPDPERTPPGVTASLPAARAAPVLVSPKGYRVEGLDVAALAALLAAVG